MRRRVMLAVAASFALASTATSAQTKAAPPAAAKKAAPAVPRMSEDVVQDALKAWDGASTRFGGLLKEEGDSTHLFVTSARQRIAKKGYDLSGTTGKYTPPADARRDVVDVVCGDNDRSEIFNCVKVTVVVGGKTIKPIAYGASNDWYENGFGAKWRAKDVLATYLVAGLENGFTVTYADDSGVEWEFEVTADDAAKELLLTLKAPK
jgi:hypothetical protein